MDKVFKSNDATRDAAKMHAIMERLREEHGQYDQPGAPREIHEDKLEVQYLESV